VGRPAASHEPLLLMCSQWKRETMHALESVRFCLAGGRLLQHAACARHGLKDVDHKALSE
jgi:hypothetical protein